MGCVGVGACAARLGNPGLSRPLASQSAQSTSVLVDQGARVLYVRRSTAAMRCTRVRPLREGFGV